jgi:hypothetical protein
MKNVSMIVLSILLLLSLRTPAQEKKDSPTLQETFDWIAQKIDSSAGAEWTVEKAKYKYFYSPLTKSAEPCVWSLTEYLNYTAIETTRYNSSEIQTRVEIPILDVTHLRTEEGPYSSLILVIDTKGKKMHYQRHETITRPNNLKEEVEHDGVTGETYIYFGRNKQIDNHELLVRMGKALEHVADLCQSSRPKNTEPF